MASSKLAKIFCVKKTCVTLDCFALDVKILMLCPTGINNNPPQAAWSAMAELTPTAWDVITDELGGLRKMADSVNRNVTGWYQGSWGQTANVVAVDFYRGADIVATAIQWNKMKISSAGQPIKCANKWEREQSNARRLYQFFQFKFL